MGLRVVGAGLPRTGTTSLKMALERLLGAPCHHMRELVGNMHTAPTWRAAYRGEAVDWDALLDGYAAGVDWPISRFWRELSAYYPDALVLLSYRASPEAWYTSMSDTVLNGARERLARRDGGRQARAALLDDATPEQVAAMDDLWYLMGGDIVTQPDDPDVAKAAYERNLAEVRAGVPAHRLLEWQPGDGWEPLCAALGVPVPDEPFPHENTTADMQARARELQERG